MDPDLGRRQKVEAQLLDSNAPMAMIVEPFGGSICWIRLGVWGDQRLAYEGNRVPVGSWLV